ncbi:unnamed protein product [Mytilus edulis]|uniref:Up-regulator of cell proliferation-like domain-containing protein n=1 Tax=Mytilus edulis TaxID=6550 RepID=A0A8S3U5R3_MYTED|nr:unnamed protein product [Mytilus edulis]
MLNFGSIFGDSACRCDHIKGYAFVNNPKERCYCIPSDEDCTCYKKFCPPSYILTSDKNNFRNTEMPPKILYPILIVFLLVEKEPIDDFEMFIKKVGLDSFYPEAMEISDVMKIYNKEMPRHLKGIAIMFIRNLVMLNYTCRDKLLEKFIHDIRKYQQIKREDQNDDNSSNSTVNPLDLIVAVFKCSSPMLKQILATKLFMQTSYPFSFPALDKDRMLVSIWPLRSLVLEWKTNEKLSQHIAVDCPCQIVSFIRLGRPTISKSKLVNEILTDEHHNTFFNKDCNLGTTKRLVSTGMIEVAWCLPSSESILGKICMFLNLRGDGEIYANQVTLLSKISSVVVIIMETKHFNNTHYKQLLKKLHKTNTGVILVMETKNDSNTSINQILQSHSDTQIQLGKPFRYIILPGDGHTRSTVPMNNKIRNVINEITQENEDVRLSERLNACSTDIDEKKECFSMTRRMAEDLMQLIPEKRDQYH